jgi:hypothetical protein
MSIVFLDNSPNLGGGVSAFPTGTLGTQIKALFTVTLRIASR